MNQWLFSAIFVQYFCIFALDKRIFFVSCKFRLPRQLRQKQVDTPEFAIDHCLFCTNFRFDFLHLYKINKNLIFVSAQ